MLPDSLGEFMSIDLMRIPAQDAERIAYAEGYPQTAELFARIADLEGSHDEIVKLRDQIDDYERMIERLQDAICALESRLADLE